MQDVAIDNELNTGEFRRIFQLQKNASLKFRREPLRSRRERIKKLRSWITNHTYLIIEALNQDLGKPEEEVKLTEIRPALVEIRKALGNLVIGHLPNVL